jgi:hypothetical protein
MGVHARALVFLAALRHCLVTAAIVLLDCGRLLTIGLRSRRALAAENLSSGSNWSLVSGAKGQTTKGRRFHALVNGDSESNVRVLRCLVEGQTGYTHRLALQRVPAVLALEIPAGRKTTLAQRPCW